MMYARREDLTTALAIFGSATSTSFTSSGKSNTTDLPLPSDRKRIFDALVETTVASASDASVMTGFIVTAVMAEKERARISAVFSFNRSWRRYIRLFLLVTSVPAVYWSR